MTVRAHNASRRAVLSGLAGVAVGTAGTLAVTGFGSAAEPTRPEALGLDHAVAEILSGLDSDGPYRHPTSAERERALSATRRVLSGRTGQRTARMYANLGMDLRSGVDSTGRVCDMVTSTTRTPRSWGLLVVEHGAPAPGLVVEVPHPGSDQLTALIGVALFRAVPGAALLMAGAHRKAADGNADVAHEPRSLFAALAGELAERGAVQLQLHGYANSSMPDKEIVISAGATEAGARIRAAARRLSERGFAVCRAWQGGCDSLDGETNAQGRAAAAGGNPFVHLEMNHSVRADASECHEVIAAIAETYGPAR